MTAEEIAEARKYVFDRIQARVSYTLKLAQIAVAALDEVVTLQARLDAAEGVCEVAKVQLADCDECDIEDCCARDCFEILRDALREWEGVRG